MSAKKKFNIDEMPKETPFKVPDNYFEDFAAEMQNKIENEHKTVHFFHRVRPYLYVAASVVVILTVSLFVFDSNNDAEMIANKDVVDTTITNDSSKDIAVSETPDDWVDDDMSDDEYFDEMYDEYYGDI